MTMTTPTSTQTLDLRGPAPVIPSWAFDDEPTPQAVASSTPLADIANGAVVAEPEMVEAGSRFGSSQTSLFFQGLLVLALVLAAVGALAGSSTTPGTDVTDPPPSQLFQPSN